MPLQADKNAEAERAEKLKIINTPSYRDVEKRETAGGKSNIRPSDRK
jgi:hypothetical protein